MRLSRRSRFAAALIALLSVLFTQLAVAAYACPRMQIAQAMESIAEPVAAAERDENHDMAGCTGMDAQVSPRCQDYGQSGNQSLDKPELPHVPPFITARLVQAVSHDDLAYPATTPASTSLSLTRTTAPPLAIQHCCFRI